MLGSIITCAVFLEILPSSWNLAGWLGIPKLIYVIMKTFKNTKLCSFIVTVWMIIKLAIIYPTSVLVPPKMDGDLFMQRCMYKHHLILIADLSCCILVFQ